MAAREIPFPITGELRRLASVWDPEIPTVTLYLDARGKDQHQREALRTFVRSALARVRRTGRRPAPAGASLEADLARLELAVGELNARGAGGRAPGIALFVCTAKDLFVELRSPVPFRNQFGIDAGPLLAQLSFLADEYEPALLALVDSESARIFQSALGGVLSELDLTSDVPGRHKQGGWSQARYQRHIRAHQDEHHKAVAAVLAEGLDGQGIPHLILGGPRQARLNLRRFLGSALEGRIIGELDVPVRAALPRVQGAARAVLQAWEREQEAEVVQLLRNQAGNPGQAAQGLADTVAAVNQHRVHRLLLAVGFAGAGWACSACRTLLATATPECPRCGHELALVDLREALVAAVLCDRGAIEWVAAQPFLERLGGVGALLRSPRGMR